MLDRHPVAFDVRPTHRGGVQQQVHQMVRQQVDLVDVEHPAMGGGEQPRLVRLDPVGEGTLQVEGADHPVLGGADRQLDQGGAAPLADRPRFVRAVRAVRVRVGRVAGEPAAGDDVDVGQQRRERPDDGRLGGALLTPDQHPADRRGDRVEQQGQPQFGQADDGGERVRRGHRPLRRAEAMLKSLPRVSTPACGWVSPSGRSLLTPGSTLPLDLPAARPWPVREGSLPGHSGGTAPDSHRVPPRTARAGHAVPPTGPPST